MSVSHPKYSAIKTAMLLHVPFFASLLMDIMDVRVGKFPEKFGPLKNTAATDGKVIWFDEDWLASLNVEGGVFVTCHEVAHTMFEHMSRAKRYVDLGFDGEHFEPLLWNVAADYVINDMLVKSGFKMPMEKDEQTGKMVQMGLHDPKYTADMGVEEVYRALRKQQKQQQKKQGGSGKGAPDDGSGDPGGHGGFDKHIFKPSELGQAELKRAIQSAVNAAKAIGKLPAGLERFAEELLDSKIPWSEMLRHIVTLCCRRETSDWRLPHKRRLTSQGIYLARPSGFGCGTVVWIFDTSGSIGPREINAFGGEGAEIMRACRPEKIYLLGCDSEVASVVELDGNEDLTTDMIKVKGGGGTDFRPPFEWIRDQGINPAAVIYFTDGYGPFPDSAPEYPVIWAMTTDVTPPWGELVKIEGL